MLILVDVTMPVGYTGFQVGAVTNDAKPCLAIIGGGQLGMFLCEAARKLGIKTLIITPDANGPANDKADSCIVSTFDCDGLAGRIADMKPRLRAARPSPRTRSGR